MACLIRQDTTLNSRYQTYLQRRIEKKKGDEKERLKTADVSNLFNLLDSSVNTLMAGLPINIPITKRPFSSLDMALHLEQVRNQMTGTVGEIQVLWASLLGLPDSYFVFENGLILEPEPEQFTQIDHALINSAGVFLIETKAWKGSFLAHQDEWKRRDSRNQKWIPCSSPTSQSAYHAKALRRYLTRVNPALSATVRIQPLVAFTRAKWIRVTEPRIPVFQGIGPLVHYLQQQTQEHLSVHQREHLTDVLIHPR